VFGMAMPRVWGGPELDPLTQFRVIEALAMAYGSVGWCADRGGFHKSCRLNDRRREPPVVISNKDETMPRCLAPEFPLATPIS